ncbi:concanavalin A-like lectin/glucanase [Neocallimastix lanati (nom. inval.)]|nr:concanavalin A-like lectin/glucanase [Neocallimastix sp. JGI-2020a]
MNLIKVFSLLVSLATIDIANAQSFCSTANHSGQSVTEYSNKVSSINGIGYELWADSGNNSATFYSDGSFSCTFQNAKDYLCRSGLSFDSTKTHDQLGHMYADFKLVKQNIQNVDYSYVGIYGWSRSPLVEYYIVDNWLSQWRPGDWVGNKKHGDFVIDGATYTVYENTRTGPSIDGNTTFKQFFSIRKEARDCGTIDITAHFQQWEKLGMKLGKMHEAKVLGEAGSNGGGTTGTADFPYAKVYIGSSNEWGINNGEWCGCGGSSNDKDTDGNTENYNENNSSNNIKSDYCSTAKHSGQSVTEYSNKVGNIGNVGYELWADSGNNSATFYSDGSFSCTFQNAKDYLCRSGLSFDSTKTHDQLGHMYADFKLVKQNIQNVDYSYVGIYGWSRSPLVEYYIVDNWLSQWRPGDWVGNKKHGDFTIDGATYTVYENDRYGPSIDGDTQFKQFFSIRQNPRDCGTIDITAHFQQWEKLGMKLGKMHEAKVLGEAGSNGGGTTGTADFPYAKVYIGSSNSSNNDSNTNSEDYKNYNSSSNNIKSDYCSTAKHSGQSVTEYSNKVGNIGNVGYELWADSGNNSATFYSDGSFSCTFQNAKDYLCRSGLSFDSTKTHDQLGHMYADFKLVKQNIQNVDYSYVGIYGWSRSPLVEYYIVDNWLSQWRPGDWVGNKKHGDFTIDGATYTVYENDRYGPSIDGDTQFKQFFSIRQNPRDCGTIDITAHFQQWEKLGMKLGKMHEAKVLGEAGSNGSGTSGTADFPYAKVYIGSGNSDNTSGNTSGNTSSNTSSYPKGSGLKFYTQCNNPKHWAMTYDDGPTEFADAILDLLKEKNMKATFFVLGQMYMDANSYEWKRLVKRMDSEGHIVGTHTYTHPDLTSLSYQQIMDEMNKITNAVYSAIGKKPAFMRPPYGSGSGNQTVMGALQAAGYTAAITWNVDPMDYSNGGDINYAKQVINQARGRPIITLNHLKYGGSSQSGILALANAEIELMLANGYTPVTMEECLGISAYQ